METQQLRELEQVGMYRAIIGYSFPRHEYIQRSKLILALGSDKMPSEIPVPSNIKKGLGNIYLNVRLLCYFYTL